MFLFAEVGFSSRKYVFRAKEAFPPQKESRMFRKHVISSRFFPSHPDSYFRGFDTYQEGPDSYFRGFFPSHPDSYFRGSSRLLFQVRPRQFANSTATMVLAPRTGRRCWLRWTALYSSQVEEVLAPLDCTCASCLGERFAGFDAAVTNYLADDLHVQLSGGRSARESV